MAAAAEDIAHNLPSQLEELRKSYDEAVLAPKTVRRAEDSALVVFEVGSAAFAVRADRLVEVIRAEGMVAVPCSPPHIAGAVTHRQEVVGVSDLRTLLELSNCGDAKSEWVLVLRPRSSQHAILADSVIGVRKIDPGQLDGAVEGPQGTSILAGSIVIGDRPVAILDTDALASAVAAT